MTAEKGIAALDSPAESCSRGTEGKLLGPAAGVLLFGLVFVSIHLALRVALIGRAAQEIDWNVGKMAGVLVVGIFYDLVTASYFVLPLVLYLLVCPTRWFRRGWHQKLLALFLLIALYVLLFDVVAEWLFWSEFEVRFNFIAVDYLIYTKEVIGNIRESYSLPLILGTLLAVTLAAFWSITKCTFFSLWLKQQALDTPEYEWRNRLVSLWPFLAIPMVVTFLVNGRQVPSFGNRFNQELAKNGLYSLGAEFRNNELSYEQFYNKLETGDAFARVRGLIGSENQTFLSTNVMDLSRAVRAALPERRWNVIQITVESLSAEFLGAFGNTQHLTPNLDALAANSLFFTNFYATGTRTVRGMEALTLSLPPTPGQSIVRRPDNENLFSLGSVFKKAGYDTSFIYGGYGYFDNMNYFFANNGYRVIDRTVVPSTNITFANVWGACDEDVFRWSLKEADAAFARKQPFFQFVMTTSNHRPFTFPEGKIDIRSHSGREGGVKYTDYAIGQLINEARARPWFTNTLFVIVADHCAASAGHTDLPVKKYQIPLIIYNPTLVPGQGVGKLCSQIDYPPTLLGLMNWSYRSRFFGKDILKMTAGEERALIGTYQNLGLLRRDQLAILKPVRQKSLYQYEPGSGNLTHSEGKDDLILDCIAYYQTASYSFSQHLYKAIIDP